MLSINTNLSSLITQRSMKQSTNLLNQAIERMTTGAKINHAKDNAANFNIATNMDTKIGSYNVAEDNCAMGLDLIATAEGNLTQIQNKLQRLRDLQEQASNGTYGEDSLEAINTEVNALVDEINRIYSTAEYNGMKLFGTNETSPTSPIATFALARASTISIDESYRVSNVSSFISGKTYYITTSDDLVALQELVNDGANTNNVTFELTNDVDMNGVNFRGIGVSTTTEFHGIFNGNENTISNLTISTSEDYVGLFGYSDGTITKTELEDVDITGGKYVGGICGYNKGGSISEIAVSGNVNGGTYIGGITGYLDYGGSIINSYTNINVFGTASAGGLIGACFGDFSVQNCFSYGTVLGNNYIGGLIGELRNGSRDEVATVINSYSTANIQGENYVGGFAGYIFAKESTFTKNYSTGNVTGTSDVGTFAGYFYLSDTPTNSACIINTGLDVISSGAGGEYIEELALSDLQNKYTFDYMGFTADNGWNIQGNTISLSWQDNFLIMGGTSIGGGTTDPTDPDAGGGTGGSGSGTGPSYAPDTIMLQIGTASNWASQVGVSTKFELPNLDDLRMIGLDKTTDYLEIIDEKLNLVSEKLTHFGASSNRLESVLEEITISRDNLISSRSTLRDADISEVSSEYIRQQILQQASATLMATANQNASIALSLI